MPRRAGDVQIQLSVEPELRRAIGMATLAHEDHVPTSRVLDRATMITLVVRAFLDLPEDKQRKMLVRGLELAPKRETGGRGGSKAEKESVPRNVRRPLPVGPAKGGKVEPGSENDAVRGPKDAPTVKK